MKIKAAIKEYLIEIEVRKYSPRTIKTYRNNLNLFLRFAGNGMERGWRESEFGSTLAGTPMSNGNHNGIS